ncbi:MAG: DUF3592 domain-containing protein [Gemmatimonadota bacterium]|nr:DUF3592 domain-containing protein [Gemmatimonadota bacterium]
MATPRSLAIIRGLGVLWLVIGCVMLGLGARQASDAVRSITWPKTPGTVLESVVQRRPRNAHDLRDSVSVPLVRYRYSLGGVLYHSTRVSFKKFVLGTEREARSTVANYPPGTDLSVYFDPERPGNAVLEHGISWLNMLVLIAGSILIGVGGRWMRKRGPRPARVTRRATAAS